MDILSEPHVLCVKVQLRRILYFKVASVNPNIIVTRSNITVYRLMNSFHLPMLCLFIASLRQYAESPSSDATPDYK